jgi:cell division protein FtsI/penicillin-binding protein 2
MNDRPSRKWLLALISALFGALLLSFPAADARQSTSKPKTAQKNYVAPKSSSSKPAKAPAKKSTKRRSYGIPTFADSTVNDVAEFDDPAVREAAVEAIGRYNGTVVVVDPTNGRILSIVNQPLAFAAGFQPCSTVKPYIGVAALEEGIITRDSMIKVGRRRYLNLTEALAHSDNPFFEELGGQMGFEKVSQHAKLLGLGELAGYNILEEHPGVFPSAPPEFGGVRRMSSFGEGIQMTPLQLASLAVTIANGGTMYYLQYPRTEEERRNFQPMVKRKLEIEPFLPDVREGMLAAVLYGTGRRAFDPDGEQALGKTGTCSGQGSRLGWFVSYADQLKPKLVVVVLMRGRSRVVNGPTAADIAGRVYAKLRERNYFGDSAEHAAAAAAGSGH